MSKTQRCEICNCVLNGSKKVKCDKKSCESAIARIRYHQNKKAKLLRRPCPCCGRIIQNSEDKYCSDMCIVNSEGISNTEEKYIKEHKYNITALARLAEMLPENRRRLNEIQERLERKYKQKYKFSLPVGIMLLEFGFIDDTNTMGLELYDDGLLAGSSYEEVAFDISRYRKLWDYGILLDLVE